MANPYRVTIQKQIIGALRRHGGWMSGMELESRAYEWKSKRIGRTLRDMSSGEESVLEKRYSYVGAVEYKLREVL